AVEKDLAAVVPDAVDVTADRVVGILERPGVADYDRQPGPEVGGRLHLDALVDHRLFLGPGEGNGEPQIRRAWRAAGAGHRRFAPGVREGGRQDLAGSGIGERDRDGARRAGIAGPPDDDELPVRPVPAVDPPDGRRLAFARVQD